MSDNKERVAQLLGDGLEEIVSIVKSAKTLAKEELPQVVKEIMLLALAYDILELIVGLGLLIAGVAILLLTEVGPNATPFGALSIIIGAIFTFASAVDLLKLKYAPKLYLIEELKRLVQ